MFGGRWMPAIAHRNRPDQSAAGPKDHAASVPTLHDDSGAAPGEDAAAGPAPQLWTCSMHPQVIQDHPGQCPICHMELTPLSAVASSDRVPSTSTAQPRIKYWW